MRRRDSARGVIAVLAVLALACTACGGGTAGGSPMIVSQRPAPPSSSTTTARPHLPTATGEYADAVRAAVRHGLRVWIEADLVKRWEQGRLSFDQALGQIGTLAALPGVAGIKIADEMGYHDGLNTPAKIRAFLTAAGQGLAEVAPGKPLLVDMIVPELGCLPDARPPNVWATICDVKTGGRYPQISPENVTEYLRMRVISVLDVSTGLLPDGTYTGWGVDRDIAQNAAWAEVNRLGWPALTQLHARKALAHPGRYARSDAAAAADVHTWVDLPKRDGAQAIDIWTWRQVYHGVINRILDPGLTPNALWAQLLQRRAQGDRLYTHLSPNSVEVSLNADLTMMSKVFTDVFIAAGTG